MTYLPGRGGRYCFEERLLKHPQKVTSLIEQNIKRNDLLNDSGMFIKNRNEEGNIVSWNLGIFPGCFNCSPLILLAPSLLVDLRSAQAHWRGAATLGVKRHFNLFYMEIMQYHSNRDPSLRCLLFVR